MLAKAVHDHNPAVSGLKGTTLSQHYQATANVLKPSPSSLLNSSCPPSSASGNPLKRTASQANSRESPFSVQEHGVHKKAMIDLTHPSANGGRVGKLHNDVYFDENDFEDDADIDLDGNDSPVTIKESSLTPSASTLLPDLGQKKHAAPRTPASSMPLPWSSSPLSHHQMPPPKTLPKLSPKLAPTAKTTKRRTLPWLDEASTHAEEPNHPSTATRGKGPPAFVKDIIQRKAGAKAARVAEGEDDYPARDTMGNGPPDWVRDKIQQAKEHKKALEATGEAYTPLPKDKSNSPFPWNKTASAVKEEQKKLRQGHRKLVKDVEGETRKVANTRKKRESVARVFLSDEQKSVLELVAEKKKSVFFTGSAGTGKSVLLRETIKVLRDKYKREPDRVAVTASTGLAACNVGGVTLHSFAGIGLGKEAVPELVRKIKRNAKPKNRWLRTKVLIIDEISMVDGDLFDKLEAIARSIRNNGRPFGGIQLVITGDFFQLPPVPDYGRIAKFAFDAATWNTSIEHTIGLTQVFRQKDPGMFVYPTIAFLLTRKVFANMLNEMRLGRLTPKSIDSFRKLNRSLSFGDDFQATEL